MAEISSESSEIRKILSAKKKILKKNVSKIFSSEVGRIFLNFENVRKSEDTFHQFAEKYTFLSATGEKERMDSY